MVESVTAAVYPDAAITRLSNHQLNESVTHIDPDVVFVSDRYHEVQLHAAQFSVPVLSIEDIQDVWVSSGPGPQIACLSSVDGVQELQALEADGTLDTAAETFVVSPLLEVDIDLTQLETELTGRDGYVHALSRAGVSGSYTHVTPYAAPTYDADWGGLRVHGAMPGADETGVTPTTDIAVLSMYGDGTVTGETLPGDAFGLQGINHVGPKTAETLRSAGYSSVSDVAGASVDELEALDGFGRSTSTRVVYSARALSNGEVYRRSSESLPSREPVFIDIETDGLTPTMIWLIGVLDSKTGEYMSFMETDPEHPGRAVEGFMMWFAANATHRPVVAYNGQDFDFPAIHEHVDRYCPRFTGDWANAWTFDPYWWGVKRNNAVFPGRTNKLGDVASALGWESSGTGLTGAVVGKRFQAWMADPCDENALEWDRHEAYCEDDVRALKHVYDALQDAERVDGVQAASQSGTGQTGSQTAQGTLRDF